MMPPLSVPFAQTAVHPPPGYTVFAAATAAQGIETIDVAAALWDAGHEALRLDPCCHLSAAGQDALGAVIAAAIRPPAPGQASGLVSSQQVSMVCLRPPTSSLSASAYRVVAPFVERTIAVDRSQGLAVTIDIRGGHHAVQRTLPRSLAAQHSKQHQPAHHASSCEECPFAVISHSDAQSPDHL